MLTTSTTKTSKNIRTYFCITIVLVIKICGILFIPINNTNNISIAAFVIVPQPPQQLPSWSQQPRHVPPPLQRLPQQLFAVVGIRNHNVMEQPPEFNNNNNNNVRKYLQFDSTKSTTTTTTRERISCTSSTIDIAAATTTFVMDTKRRSMMPQFLLITTALAMAVVVPSTAQAVVLSVPSSSVKDLKEDYRQGTAALGSSNDDMAPVPREAYVKLPSGVIYADVVTPKLPTSSATTVVQVGSKVNIQWVLRRSNGYFVDSSQINDSIPFVFTVGNGGSGTNNPAASSTAIAGLDEGIRGMQVGGVRRLLIPPSLAYVTGVDDTCPGPIPVGFGPRQQIRRIQNVRKDVPGEYIYLEIQLTRLR